MRACHARNSAGREPASYWRHRGRPWQRKTPKPPTNRTQRSPVLTFASDVFLLPFLPSPLGPVPSSPRRSRTELHWSPSSRGALFLSGISRRLRNSLRRKQQARATPSSHDLGPIVSAPCPVRPDCCGYPAIVSRARLMRVTAVSILPRIRASRRDRGATRFHGFSEPFGSIR